MSKCETGWSMPGWEPEINIYSASSTRANRSGCGGETLQDLWEKDGVMVDGICG